MDRDARAEMPRDLDTAARLFGEIWGTVSEMLGTATAAALLRRAAKRALARDPDLGDLEIARDGLEYTYRVPEAWTRRDGRALRALALELCGLLIEMTGPLVVRRLERIRGFGELRCLPEKQGGGS